MLNLILRLFFPDRCLICDEILPFKRKESFLCDRCLSETEHLETIPTCSLCGMPSSEILCNSCLTHRHIFNKAISCFPYQGALRESVLRFKFRNRRDLSRGYSKILSARVVPLHIRTPFGAVVYAPMTDAAERERGYHQTKLLAEGVSRSLGIPLCENLLLKKKETPKQSTLSYRERWQNVSGAFALVPGQRLTEKRVVLIDDVLTTGATADALSRLLKSAGAEYVLVATIAKTVEPLAGSITEQDELAVTF